MAYLDTEWPTELGTEWPTDSGTEWHPKTQKVKKKKKERPF